MLAPRARAANALYNSASSRGSKRAVAKASGLANDSSITRRSSRAREVSIERRARAGIARVGVCRASARDANAGTIARRIESHARGVDDDATSSEIAIDGAIKT
jgi:hypothetical protein